MNKQEILNYVSKKYEKNEKADFRVGDTVRVHVRIREGNATRVQVYEGVVISFKGNDKDKTFTVRKVSFGIGVERVFPLRSPLLEKIQVTRSGHVRRAKLYFLRDRVGKSARLEEIERKEGDKKGKKGLPEIKAVPQKEALVGAEKDS